MSNGYEAKILTPYIHALKDVVLRLYLIVVKICLLANYNFVGGWNVMKRPLQCLFGNNGMTWILYVEHF